MAAIKVKYECGDCGQTRPRDKLVAKRVQFREMGVTGKVIQTRVVGWLCKVKGADGKTCLERDPDFGREKYASAPGTAAKKTAGD